MRPTWRVSLASRRQGVLAAVSLCAMAFATAWRLDATHAQACHGQPMPLPEHAGAQAAAPRVRLAASLTTRYASFHRTVGAGQVATLIPGLTLTRGPYALYGDITLSTRTFRGDAVTGVGNPTFGVAGTWWTRADAAHGRRFGLTIDLAGMAPGGDDQLLADDHWMMMPAAVLHATQGRWRLDVGAMYHHSFVQGDHGSDFHILNVVRPMRHRGESLTLGLAHTVSPRLTVDVSGTLNVRSSLQLASAGLAYGLRDGLRLTTRVGMVTLFSKLDPVVSLALARGW